MQLFHSSILKSYLQIVFLTYAIRNITMPAYSTGLLVCFYIFFLTNDYNSTYGKPKEVREA